MTPEQITEARRLCDAATEGPWYVGSSGFEVYAYDVLVSEPYDANRADSKGDAAFIAAARTGWPATLDALEEALAENERHGKANLVRAVISGVTEYDDWVTDAANTEFDRIPWRVAESMKHRLEAAQRENAQLRDVIQRVLDDVAEGPDDDGPFAGPAGWTIELARRAVLVRSEDT